MKLDELPQQERQQYCYCKEPGQSHCGVCGMCGKPGHLRPLMFCTMEWCDDCYEIAAQRINDTYDTYDTTYEKE